MRWYADNSDLAGIRESEGVPDIVMLGGYAIPHAEVVPFQTALEEIKNKYGGALRCPCKWNMKDLAKACERHGYMEHYVKLLGTSSDWRREMFNVAAKHNITIIAACVESYSMKREHIKEFKTALSGYSLCNALMRVGLHATEQKETTAEVVLDWPDGGDSTPFDMEYASAYSKGVSRNKGRDGKPVPYLCGSLNKLGFADAIYYSHMRHSTLLQFADLVTGALRDMINCANGKQQPGLGLEVLKVVKTKIRGPPGKIVGRGISIHGGTKKLENAVRDFVSKELG